MDKFKGEIVHSQDWDPTRHSVAGKRVVVIGSGATAVTLIPVSFAKVASRTYYMCILYSL